MEFTFEHCTVIRVTDGDTIRAVIDTGFGNTHSDAFRLLYVMAPEIRGVERPQGLLSKDWLHEKIFGKKVKIVCHGQEKYGRWLATIYLDGVNINELIVAEGFATT